MTSSRPYLIRALYEWILENELTPYLLVDAQVQNLKIPTQHVQDGKIVLNISPTAIQSLQVGNECVEFSARFSGKEMSLLIPVHAVLAIYAMENGPGMVFSAEDAGGAGGGPSGSKGSKGPKDKAKANKPKLKIVK